jgi:GH35 family endo-1,4-beta-xylanase
MRPFTCLLTCILVISLSLLTACAGSQQGASSSSSSSSSSGGIKNHSFFIGSTSPSRLFRSDFAEDWQLMATQFEGTWGAVEGTRGTYNWQWIDNYYNFARDNNILFHHSALIWGAQQPAWSFNISPEDTRLKIAEWVKLFCNRYQDVQFITVVNEPLPGHQPARHAQKAFGDDWILESFELTRKYCPNSFLLVNDYDLFAGSANDFIALIAPAVDAGFVDGIGIEGAGIKDISAAQITAVLDDLWRRFQLPLYITDFIVAGDDALQLKTMQEQFPAFYNHPKVRGITFASDIDGETWFSNSGLFYKDHTPRPAMQWLQDYVKNHPRN